MEIKPTTTKQKILQKQIKPKRLNVSITKNRLKDAKNLAGSLDTKNYTISRVSKTFELKDPVDNIPLTNQEI